MGQLQRRVVDVPHQVGGTGQTHLAADRPELGVPDAHGYAAAVQPLLPQPPGHAVAERLQAAAHLLPAGQVFRKGRAVAHGLYRLMLVLGADRGIVQPICVAVELHAHLAHELLQQLRLARRQLPDGLHAVLCQRAPGGAAHVQQIAHRQRPHHVPPVLPGDHGGGVRLLVVAAQLGEHLVEGDAHGDGQPQLLPQTAADIVRQLPGVAAEQVEAAGHVQPALIDAEGLHQIGVLPVDGVDPAGVVGVQIVVGRQEDELGTLLLGLPHRLRRLDTHLLGGLVFRQDDAVPGGGVAADGHRHILQRRLLQQLHRREKAVQITVENDAVGHGGPSSQVECLFYYTTGGGV